MCSLVASYASRTLLAAHVGSDSESRPRVPPTPLMSLRALLIHG